MALNLFDSGGTPVAYSDDGMLLYLFSGEPVGYMEKGSVYSYSGRHIGFFENGWIMDNCGYAVLFSENAKGGPIRPIRGILPIKGIKGILPIKGIQEIKPLKPIRQIGWSDISINLFFSQ